MISPFVRDDYLIMGYNTKAAPLIPDLGDLTMT